MKNVQSKTLTWVYRTDERPDSWTDGGQSYIPLRSPSEPRGINMSGPFNFSIGKKPIHLPMDKDNVALALCNPIPCRLNSRYVCKYNCYELQSRAKSQYKCRNAQY